MVKKYGMPSERVRFIVLEKDLRAAIAVRDTDMLKRKTEELTSLRLSLQPKLPPDIAPSKA